MGFTRYESMATKELTEKQAARLTRKLQKAGTLPKDVCSVVQASVSDDDGKCDGEWKVFVCIELIVTAASSNAAFRMAAPEELLLLVADKMTGGDADSQYGGLSGTFEILEVDPCPEATEQAAGALA